MPNTYSGLIGFPFQMTLDRKVALVMGKFAAQDAAKSLESSRWVTELVAVRITA